VRKLKIEWPLRATSMYFFITIFILAIIGVLLLFIVQLIRLRRGLVDHLPNVTFGAVVAPLMTHLTLYAGLALERIHLVTYPLLLHFYEVLLRFLHTLISRIANRFNHLADAIKGKGVVVGRARTPSLHWQKYRKLE